MFAGTARLLACSGRTYRHRLSRGDDRQPNRALHLIVTPRSRIHPATQTYMLRRTSEGEPRRDQTRSPTKNHRPPALQTPASPRPALMPNQTPFDAAERRPSDTPSDRRAIQCRRPRDPARKKGGAVPIGRRHRLMFHVKRRLRYDGFIRETMRSRSSIEPNSTTIRPLRCPSSTFTRVSNASDNRPAT